MGGAIEAGSSVASDAAAWRSAIARALCDPDEPTLVFQPIVDLRRGVVAGYEALSRFAGPPTASPDAWFAAADRLGLAAQLEARVVTAAIAARDRLPAGCFLTVNVSPHLMHQPELADVLTAAPDLSRLVLELTEHVQIDDHARLNALLDQLRAVGATVALDDAGSGYSGLQQLALVRPELVKIDRALVDHADRDEVKLALAELLGSYAGRLDAALIAEGIERPEELEAFIRMGVPLGQGWLFGRPTPTWTTLAPELGEWIRALADDRSRGDRIASLVERTTSISDSELGQVSTILCADPSLEFIAVLDRNDRAVCLVRRQLRSGDSLGETHVLSVSLRASADAEVADVATRAMTRPTGSRFDPVVCEDSFGGYAGIVRPERMMLRLAQLTSAPASADGPDRELWLVGAAARNEG
ncbi:EAL domain-containing protein [Blastococcus sp. TF02A_35]|uniref:EAL domain-containing protein n=1 Tax=Blastococcus sp. TF02A-35 TaxID=2559612 RepID=UPI00107469FC|nr:EAL domain-containing protein [Blastococcus sp. TF02A_35]TFV51551.1 EAL domain-containing protein [Blastococcus sp. TF02A_35]